MSGKDFDPARLFEQAKELTGKMQRVQEQLRLRTVEATVGGGMVTVVANGQMQLVSVTIDPQAVDPRDVEMLQDLVVAAVNQALGRAQKIAQEEMQKVTGIPLGSVLGDLGGQDG